MSCLAAVSDLSVSYPDEIAPILKGEFSSAALTAYFDFLVAWLRWSIDNLTVGGDELRSLLASDSVFPSTGMSFIFSNLSPHRRLPFL